MAINKLRDNKSNNKYNDIIDDNTEEPLMILIKSIFEKVDESVIKTNEHITKMAINDDKVGITTAQADAIVANTKKTGISTAQANLITALNQGISQNIPTNQKNITAVIEPTIVIGKTASTLDFKITLSDKSVYTTSLTLTKKK